MEKGFTLVIPLYNKVNAISSTLDSVLNNHGGYPFKCIIVDDDSTDGSSEIAMEYDTNYPDIFMYIKKKHRGHKGPAYARNLGIKLADTEYIGFLDADDELCSGFIDRGCNFLDEYPEYNSYSNGHTIHSKDIDGSDHYFTVYTNTDKCVFNDFIDAIVSGYCNVHFCATIYKTELVKQILFGDVFCEDSVFKLEYCYKFLPVYIDNSTAESIIFNEFNSESREWNTINTYKTIWQLEILLSFKNKSKCDKYDFWLDENNNVIFQILK